MASCEKFDDADCCLICLKPRRHATYRRMCVGPPKTNPPLARRVLNFAKALAAHQANGSPQSTDEEVAQKDAACAGCPLLVGGICTHFDCGCPVARYDKWRLKVKWADSTCPLERWKETEWQQSHRKPAS